ncbi:hypothetical protein C8J56DRAFT_1040477 [Mycena floridula]|nr:hypothetical protein C8J56DRAFT_1040477 [Mycena floridula]
MAAEHRRSRKEENDDEPVPTETLFLQTDLPDKPNGPSILPLPDWKQYDKQTSAPFPPMAAFALVPSSHLMRQASLFEFNQHFPADLRWLMMPLLLAWTFTKADFQNQVGAGITAEGREDENGPSFFVTFSILLHPRPLLAAETFGDVETGRYIEKRRLREMHSDNAGSHPFRRIKWDVLRQFNSTASSERSLFCFTLTPGTIRDADEHKGKKVLSGEDFASEAPMAGHFASRSSSTQDTTISQSLAFDRHFATRIIESSNENDTTSDTSEYLQVQCAMNCSGTMNSTLKIDLQERSSALWRVVDVMIGSKDQNIRAATHHCPLPDEERTGILAGVKSNRKPSDRQKQQPLTT